MPLGPDATSPATHAEAVTPNDSTVLGTVRALYVGGGGDVSVVTLGGDTATFVGVTSGCFLPVSVTRVRATGTTATNILALR